MQTIIRRNMFGALVAALAVMGGCRLSAPPTELKGGSEAAWRAIADGAPVRTAVYMGAGARGLGMFRWMQILGGAPELRTRYVDGEAIRAGALDDTDLLVMPGGMSNIEAQQLGREGRLAVRRFIENGGSYLGTCAGAFLLMQRKSAKDSDDYELAILPFKHRPGPYGDESMLQVTYSDEAEKRFGTKAGKRMERYHGGPVMDPCGYEVPGSDIDLVSRFTCNIHSFEAKKDKKPSPMGGGGSAAAGTFGKGRVWAFATHPESYPRTWGSVKDALRFLTGRTVTLDAPQRRRGQLAVGWWCAPSPEVEGANLVRSLARDDEMHVEPMGNDEVKATAFRHVDAFVVPDSQDEKRMKTLPLDALSAFMDRGGTVVTWGDAAKRFKPHANLVVATDAADVAAHLRSLARSPAPAHHAPPPKVADPVRAAVFFDSGTFGASSLQLVRMMALSPDFAFTPVNGKMVRAGVLKDADIYIGPGGSSQSQAFALKPAGRTNVVEFVRGGGGYLGICAGNSLALTQQNPKTPRLGLLPYVKQKSPARGGAFLSIRFTEDAGLLGMKTNSLRMVRYHDGPVLEPSDAIPGAEYKEIARYACDGIYAYSTNEAPTMLGRPAVVAGTFGKGRVVVSSSHPENNEGSQDIVWGALRYLTGRDVGAEFPQRVRGNLAVGFHGSHIGVDGARLLADLFRTPSLDVRGVDGETIGYGSLEHLDALVLSHPKESDFTPQIVDFVRRGGTLLFFDAKKIPADLPTDLPNVVVCIDAADLKDKLLKLAESGASSVF